MDERRAQVCCWGLLAPAFGDVGVGIDAAVAEERPDAAEIFDLLEVDVVEEDFLVFDGGLGDDFAVGIREKTLSPKFGAVVRTCAVDGADEAAVGDGVAALDGFPGAVLGGAEFGFFLGEPADGGGVEDHLCAAESHEAGGLGVPLIPADEDANFPEGGVPDGPIGIAGGEVEFFFEGGVLGDVRFAVDAEEGAVGGVDGGGVVVEAGAAFLE